MEWHGLLAPSEIEMTEQNPPSLLAAIECHYQELTSYFTRKFGNPSFATEIVHETYLRVRRLPTLQTINNARAYLFRVAMSLAIDSLRRERRREKYVSAEPVLPDVPAEASSPDVTLDDHRQLVSLSQAIDELPPKCRQVFLMRKFAGIEQEEIARQLGISRNMVEKHLRKALAHCRARVAEVRK
jgi:RNA polymerase sigma-70 factor (ECF subfamily)